MKKGLLAILLGSATLGVYSNANAQGTLLYYWNFNSITSPYSGSTPGVTIYADIAANYAAPSLDTATGRWVDRTIPGTSSAYSSYWDITGGDTTNARFGDIAGNCFRARNPNDSLELLIYAPTTHYGNLQIKYACELSSTTSGDSANVFSYSVDSGTTWITSGTGLSEWADTGWTSYRLISVHVNDPLTYNNPKFVFRIHLVGRNSGTSGNNRFDNVTIEGDTVNTTLGINQQVANGPSYHIYPNPARQQIEISSNSTGNKSIIITNLLGQSVMNTNADGMNFPINISSLTSGLYYISIRESVSGNTTTMKFAKQ